MYSYSGARAGEDVTMGDDCDKRDSGVGMPVLESGPRNVLGFEDVRSWGTELAEL